MDSIAAAGTASAGACAARANGSVQPRSLHGRPSRVERADFTHACPGMSVFKTRELHMHTRMEVVALLRSFGLNAQVVPSGMT